MKKLGIQFLFLFYIHIHFKIFILLIKWGGCMMRRYEKYIQVVIFIFIIFIATKFEYNPFQTNQTSLPVEESKVTKERDELYKKIKKFSEKMNEPAEDAYIDQVWKKTPGRSGLKVNVNESYKKMKKENIFKEELLVVEQVKPKVNIEDLPPAPIYRGHPEKNMVSFLINVSWGTEYIVDILQTLKDANIRATFFIEGKWAVKNKDIVQMIFEQGHIIGNHAYSHPDMQRISKEDIYTEIHETNEVLKAITGKDPKWFAPPSGSFNDEVVKTAHSLHMETVLWTVDTIDWKNPSTDVMLHRVLSKLHPGATILMHPTKPVSLGLEKLIYEIKQKNYKIGTIEKLMQPNRD